MPDSPTSADALRKLETSLKVSLPPSLRELYLQPGSELSSDSTPLGMRLMSCDEVLDLMPNLKHPIYQKYSMVLFWTDDNSNYAGVYCGGLFDGKVFFFDHDGPYTGDLSPLFRSVPSFLEKLGELNERNRLIEAWENGEIAEGQLVREVERFHHYRFVEPTEDFEWYALPVDYRTSSATFTSSDLSIYLRCKEELSNDLGEHERRFLIYSLARFVPPDRIEEIFKYLQEDDMWVPDRVAHILGLQESERAIDAISQVAIGGNFNCRGGAVTTLAKLAFADEAILKKVNRTLQNDEAAKKCFDDTLERIRLSPSLYYQW